MAVVTVSKEIPASPDRVWQLIGGFNSLPDWLPLVLKSELQEGGRVRTLTTADADTAIQRLEFYDNARRCYRYSLVQGSLPVTDYLSTIAVHVTASSHISRVEWSSHFIPVNISNTEAITLFTGVYDNGLNALKNSF